MQFTHKYFFILNNKIIQHIFSFFIIFLCIEFLIRPIHFLTWFLAFNTNKLEFITSKQSTE